MGPIFTLLCCLKKHYPLIYKDLRKQIITSFYLEMDSVISRYISKFSKTSKHSIAHLCFIMDFIIKDPSLYGNYAILWAGETDQLNLVKRLLNDPRVDPTDNNNNLFVISVLKNRINLVELLLKDPRINPGCGDNLSIYTATVQGSFEMVELLLQDPRVDPSDDDNHTIRVATHLRIVSLLLKDPRVDPSARNNQALKRACKNGYVELVKLLLQDPRVNPKAGLEVLDDHTNSKIFQLLTKKLNPN